MKGTLKFMLNTLRTLEEVKETLSPEKHSFEEMESDGEQIKILVTTELDFDPKNPEQAVLDYAQETGEDIHIFDIKLENGEHFTEESFE